MPDEEERPRRSSLVDYLAARSVVEIMTLVLIGVVAFSILATGATVAIIEIIHPEIDTSKTVEALSTTITGILGALLGLIAGKSDTGKPP
jgi:hypothetical protein